MKELFKSKGIILFLIFMIVIANVQERNIKNASASDTDNQEIINKINY